MRLQTLYEASELPLFDMPEELERLYGRFGLQRALVYANFVSSLDGIVAIPGLPRSSASISGGFEGDRFVVGLLRCVADAVVIGAGTFREHNGPWTAEAAYPEFAEPFATLRRRVTDTPAPTLVVVTSSGELDGDEAKFRDAVVATTQRGARRMASRSSGAARIEAFGTGERVDIGELIAWLRAQGHARVLTEGGPHLMGELLTAGAVDELFLTISPVLAGGGRSDERPVLAAGTALLPDVTMRGDVVSIRRADDYVFLRYQLRSR
jgi:riboflavin biosynthesis pyrimidine reductase